MCKYFYKCYINNLSIIKIVFFVFNNNGEIQDRRIAFLGKHSYILSKDKQWDKNKTIEFKNDIPVFNKVSFINNLLVK